MGSKRASRKLTDRVSSPAQAAKSLEARRADRLGRERQDDDAQVLILAINTGAAMAADIEIGRVMRAATIELEKLEATAEAVANRFGVEVVPAYVRAFPVNELGRYPTGYREVLRPDAKTGEIKPKKILVSLPPGSPHEAPAVHEKEAFSRPAWAWKCAAHAYGALMELQPRYIARSEVDALHGEFYDYADRLLKTGDRKASPERVAVRIAQYMCYVLGVELPDTRELALAMFAAGVAAPTDNQGADLTELSKMMDRYKSQRLRDDDLRYLDDLITTEDPD